MVNSYTLKTRDRALFTLWPKSRVQMVAVTSSILENMPSHRSYPGNFVGSIDSSMNSEEMVCLLRTIIRSEFGTIGHFDGSVSVIFTFNEENFRINLPMNGAAWTVHGHIDGDIQRIRKIASQFAQLLFNVPLSFELSLFDQAAWEATPLYVRKDGGDLVECETI